MDGIKQVKPTYILMGLLIIGMCISLFLVYEHFAPNASEFCTFGENMDCGVVNKSPYAMLDGFSYLLTIDYGLPLTLINISGSHVVFELLLSNAFLGFLTLVFIFVLLYAQEKNIDLKFIKSEDSMKYVIGVLAFGVLYGGYLFFIQHSILKTYCVFCIGLDIVLISSLLLSIYIYKKVKS